MGFTQLVEHSQQNFSEVFFYAWKSIEVRCQKKPYCFFKLMKLSATLPTMDLAIMMHLALLAKPLHACLLHHDSSPAL